MGENTFAGRNLTESEIGSLLALDIPAHLGTIDTDGFPRITPIWFLWANGAFYMTGIRSRHYLDDLRRNPQASICIDIEELAHVGGIRPNRQVRSQGIAELFDDKNGFWTQRITIKYVDGEEGEKRARFRANHDRVVVRLRPKRLISSGAFPD